MCLLPANIGTVAAMLALASLAGCSGPQPASGGEYPSERAREFSPAEKAAARALSIGSDPQLVDADKPRAFARTCADAIAGMADKLRRSDALTEPQLAALDRIREIYARRATPPLKGNATERDSPAADARTAIACLREVQEF